VVEERGGGLCSFDTARAGRYGTSTRVVAPQLIRRPSGYDTKYIGLVPRLVQSDYNNVRVTLCTARALALTIYFAASSPQHNGNPSGKLHSWLKGGFVHTQRIPLVTGLHLSSHFVKKEVQAYLKCQMRKSL